MRACCGSTSGLFFPIQCKGPDRVQGSAHHKMQPIYMPGVPRIIRITFSDKHGSSQRSPASETTEIRCLEQPHVQQV